VPDFRIVSNVVVIVPLKPGRNPCYQHFSGLRCGVISSTDVSPENFI
jgi:hypothetical protein